jgi:hypothetical protein
MVILIYILAACWFLSLVLMVGALLASQEAIEDDNGFRLTRPVAVQRDEPRALVRGEKRRMSHPFR